MRLMTCLFSFVALSGAAAAQTSAPTTQKALIDPAASLRAELRTSRSLCDPVNPIWLRFSLRNESDVPVEVPLAHVTTTESGVGLPMELVTGTKELPALFLTFQSETPIALKPGSAGTGTDGAGVLRLAPRSSIGTDVDLRTLYRSARYGGQYRVEWRPLDGRVLPATAEFRVEPRKEAIIVTDYGKINCVLQYEKAPQNVENFLELVRSDFYKDKTMHRIIPGFLMQGGCPRGDGSGVRPDGKLIAAELSDVQFDVGTVAMAHKPDKPDTASCQFFIGLARVPDLDRKYTVIAQAHDDESVRTLQALAALPIDRNDRPLKPVTIRSINLVDASDATPRAARNEP